MDTSHHAAQINDKLYDGTIFHRVIPDFMIQGGDPAGTGWAARAIDSRTRPKARRTNSIKPGKLAMANSGPNTNGSQFFITVAPTTWLTGKHTIFGEVVEGQDIVVKISKVARNVAGQACQARGAGVGNDRARRLSRATPLHNASPRQERS